jgi:membrane protease YdiL (CAAX protease family)
LKNVSLGVAVVVGVMASDLLLHLLFCRLFGRAYLERFAELAATFRGQTNAAILVGALMAGVGEELVFRGWGSGWTYLAASAAVFGALHHVRGRFWPFTLWAAYQGVLFAGALVWTGALCVPMTAHFLHDLAGFLIFRRLNAAGSGAPVASTTDQSSSAPAEG